MKEATGELNVTVIVAISVGILSAFFFGVIWPMINKNFQSETSCKKATCDCSSDARADGKCECKLYNKDGTAYDIIYCTYGG